MGSGEEIDGGEEEGGCYESPLEGEHGEGQAGAELSTRAVVGVGEGVDAVVAEGSWEMVGKRYGGEGTKGRRDDGVGVVTWALSWTLEERARDRGRTSKICWAAQGVELKCSSDGRDVRKGGGRTGEEVALKGREEEEEEEEEEARRRIDLRLWRGGVVVGRKRQMMGDDCGGGNSRGGDVGGRRDLCFLSQSVASVCWTQGRSNSYRCSGAAATRQAMVILMPPSKKTQIFAVLRLHRLLRPPALQPSPPFRLPRPAEKSQAAF